MIEALPGAQGPPGHHSEGDLSTCQSPVPHEIPAWLGTVPSGCPLLQDTQRTPGEVGVGYTAAVGISIRDK